MSKDARRAALAAALTRALEGHSRTAIAAELNRRGLAGSPTQLTEWAKGEYLPTDDIETAEALDEILEAGGKLSAALTGKERSPTPPDEVLRALQSAQTELERASDLMQGRRPPAASGDVSGQRAKRRATPSPQ